MTDRASVASQPLREGDEAPDFSLASQGGESVRLRDFRGKQHVILYFYPKDDTPGCTREACDFRDVYAELREKDAAVLGISRDSVGSHVAFASKYGLPFPLLADTDGAVCGAYGVLREKNAYGRKATGIERTTFLIDKDGFVRRIYPQVRVDGHVDALSRDLEGLGP